MFTKAELFNKSLNALLLRRQIVNAETDESNEATVLRNNFNEALFGTLEDLSLKGTSQLITLELIATNPNTIWTYAYKYPDNCAEFLRIYSGFVKDNRDTHIAKETGIHNGQLAIFTNEAQAVAECVPKDIPLSALSVHAGLAVAYRNAILSAPLLVGKGAAKLTKDIEAKYIVAKAQAQEKDAKENFMFHEESVESEFVNARTS